MDGGIRGRGLSRILSRLDSLNELVEMRSQVGVPRFGLLRDCQGLVLALTHGAVHVLAAVGENSGGGRRKGDCHNHQYGKRQYSKKARAAQLIPPLGISHVDDRHSESDEI